MTAFDSLFAGDDLGMGDVSYYSGESAVVDPFYVGIHTGPQGSEYTDGVCTCPVGSVLEEDMGNNGLLSQGPLLVHLYFQRLVVSQKLKWL
jgi:hypothetical protein